ncbi:MAG: trypsin-like serine protease [Planctomycetes bacterium]|nr:trypsin-like serine protease [Planctomycetota bacterium]
MKFILLHSLVERRIRLSLLFALTLSATLAATPIIGGKRVTGARWSGVVCLTYAGRDGRHHALGTGTLVAPNLVLTAAHCIDPLSENEPFDLAKLRVYVGNGKDGGQFQGQYSVRSARAHPLYRLNAWAGEDGSIPAEANDVYDFAYLHLERSVPEFVACIPPVHQAVENLPELAPGVKVTLVGFGQREAVGDPSRTGTKNELVLPIQGLRGRTEFELEGSQESMIDRGDSGGPALIEIAGEWKLIGICSRGNAIHGSARFGLAMPAIHWVQWETGIDLGIAKGGLRIEEEVANDRIRYVTWLRERGEFENARRELARVLPVATENPEAHVERARLELARHDAKAALEAARRAAELDPFQFSTLLGRCAFRAEQFEEAGKAVAFALELDPRVREARRIRLLLGLLDDDTSARRELEAFLRNRRAAELALQERILEENYRWEYLHFDTKRQSLSGGSIFPRGFQQYYDIHLSRIDSVSFSSEPWRLDEKRCVIEWFGVHQETIIPESKPPEVRGRDARQYFFYTKNDAMPREIFNALDLLVGACIPEMAIDPLAVDPGNPMVIVLADLERDPTDSEAWNRLAKRLGSADGGKSYDGAVAVRALLLSVQAELHKHDIEDARRRIASTAIEHYESWVDSARDVRYTRWRAEPMQDGLRVHLEDKFYQGSSPRADRLYDVVVPWDAIASIQRAEELWPDNGLVGEKIEHLYVPYAQVGTRIQPPADGSFIVQEGERTWSIPSLFLPMAPSMSASYFEADGWTHKPSWEEKPRIECLQQEASFRRAVQSLRTRS